MTLIGVGVGALPCSCWSRSFSSGIAAAVFKSISFSSPSQGLINSNSNSTGTIAWLVTTETDDGGGGGYGRRDRVIKLVLLTASKLVGMGSCGRA
ncbi:unnamed protein product [Prunus armeniaca]|uniref:Uncharacterized protein n=1 Tax=Prunus armeniaca TaxID=36596 RepID=A0A6J5XRJ4_PRUAR|nr:unnamed protein product [Prunus armeniaca]